MELDDDQRFWRLMAVLPLLVALVAVIVITIVGAVSGTWSADQPALVIQIPTSEQAASEQDVSSEAETDDTTNEAVTKEDLQALKRSQDVTNNWLLMHYMLKLLN